jgi:CYTH domain-containing protein
MATEIERKFLVDKIAWNNVIKPIPHEIIQGYLVNEHNKTIRVRIKNKLAFLTIKGPTIGISRKEFEFEIPYLEAKKLLEIFCTNFIQKKRYEIIINDLTWEVDEFEHPNKGLILAEIELENENQQIDLPQWVAQEVSHNPEYFNANMLK